MTAMRIRVSKHDYCESLSDRPALRLWHAR
jgi:hypothetical protein